VSYELSDQIVRVPTAQLRESPEQKQIHADFDAAGRDSWLVADIKVRGILQPLLIAPDKVIKDGWRRWNVAKALQHADVPCVVLTGDLDSVFASAVLGRVLSLYAKCVVYRAGIEQLLGGNLAKRNSRLKQSAGSDDNSAALEQAWIKVEEVLGVPRSSLINGVRLLARIEALSGSDKMEDRDRANRVACIFRNRGLYPALRLIDERTSDEIAESFDEPADCARWDVQDSKRRHRVAGKANGRKSGAAKRANNPFAPSRPLLAKLFELLKVYSAELRITQADEEVVTWMRRMRDATTKGRKHVVSREEAAV
jgi:hypothetical protein